MSVDPTRYGHGDLPQPGAKVLDPSGRAWSVNEVLSSLRVVVINEHGSVRTFQANDLRKTNQGEQR